MKVLNLYSGLGGNRKFWMNVEVTAVEWDIEIANIYKDFFPNDIVIVEDAHSFLEKHYDEFDFIWSSPPCQSHSKVRMMASKSKSYDAIFPDMKLWEEIIFLENFSQVPYVVENVEPYYKPIIEPTIRLGRHCFWCNFFIGKQDFNDGLKHNERGMNHKGIFNLEKYPLNQRKDQLIRNCVSPMLGLYILNCALKIKTKCVQEVFDFRNNNIQKEASL